MGKRLPAAWVKRVEEALTEALESGKSEPMGKEDWARIRKTARKLWEERVEKNYPR